MMDDNQEQKTLQVDPASQSYMLETARWARFLSVVGFIAMIFIVLSAAVFLFAGQLSGEFAYSQGERLGIAIFYLLLILIFFYPMYALLKFSKLIKAAVLHTNQLEFDEAFRYLKNTFRFWGIYTIILLFIYGIAIVFALTIAVTSSI